MILNRNDECWCKSGKKYKKCHIEFDERLKSLRAQGHEIPTRDLIKNEEQIQGIRDSAKINDGVLDLVASKIKVGMSTEEIDKLVYDYTVSHGAIPAPLNYSGYPKSVCVSINDIVCHGIPDEETILEDGDIVNVDVSTILNGYYSDASRMFMIGNVSDEHRRLVEVTKEALDIGLSAVKPWGNVGDIGAAIQEYAESNGYSVVRSFGGHGVGLKFHEDPFVAHVGEVGEGMVLAPGMIFTIEPMLNEGTYEVLVDEDDDWTAFTEDGGYSAQWEYTVLVTETGTEIIAR